MKHTALGYLRLVVLSMMPLLAMVSSQCFSSQKEVFCAESVQYNGYSTSSICSAKCSEHVISNCPKSFTDDGWTVVSAFQHEVPANDGGQAQCSCIGTKYVLEQKTPWILIFISSLAFFALTLATIKSRGKLAAVVGQFTLQRRKCPFCAEPIRIDAKLCRYCRSEVQVAESDHLVSGIKSEAVGGNNTTIDTGQFKSSAQFGAEQLAIIIGLALATLATFTDWNDHNFQTIILGGSRISSRMLVILALCWIYPAYLLARNKGPNHKILWIASIALFASVIYELMLIGSFSKEMTKVTGDINVITYGIGAYAGLLSALVLITTTLMFQKFKNNSILICLAVVITCGAFLIVTSGNGKFKQEPTHLTAIDPAPKSAEPADAPTIDKYAEAIEPAQKIVQIKETPAKDNPASDNTLSKPGSSSSLKLKFDDMSWVEVRDSNHNVIFVGEYPRGTIQEVSGIAPFSLWVGRASVVHVIFNGKEVDIQSSSREDVARLKIE